VLESGEDEVNGFRLKILLSMTTTEVVQLWCREASAGKDETTWLCLIGAVDGQWYIDDMLDNQIRFYAGDSDDQFFIMDDNARPHRARVVLDYLERESIEDMDWSARSPLKSNRTHVE
jgi:GH43 family beta-xylosidase